MTSSHEKVLRIPMKDHLWEWSLPTDVTFVFHVFQGTGTKQRKHMHDVVFPAHRDLLITASPYFERLLAGDWKPIDEVSIEDCQPGAFRILLRCIYGDEYLLDSVRPSTFIPLLLAAERFDVKGVVSHLVNHAVLILAVTDSFLFEILDMLEHCQIGCANELIEMYDTLKQCRYFMDKNAAALTKHASFLYISHERLMEVLARNTLSIQEIDLYRATIRWARAQLKRANKRRTHEAIRKVLGQALFLIRFPTMRSQEFKNGPAKENILSAEEKLAIYGRIHSAGRTSSSFSVELRTGPSALPLCVYLSSVECTGCGRRILVDTEAFAKTTCNRDCWAVAYRCSCGASNVRTVTGRILCKRCGLKMWRCGNDGFMTEGICRCCCCGCDCELTSFADDSDDFDDDEESDDDDDEY